MREIPSAAVATGHDKRRPGIGTRISAWFAEHGVRPGEIEEVRGGEPRSVDFGE